MPKPFGSHTCVYINCHNSIKNQRNLSYFKFPVKDVNRCNEWKKNCGNIIIAEMDNKDLCQSLICEEHFETKDISCNSVRKVLQKCAIPKEFVVDDDEIVDFVPVDEVVNETISPRLPAAGTCEIRELKTYVAKHKRSYSSSDLDNSVPSKTMKLKESSKLWESDSSESSVVSTRLLNMPSISIKFRPERHSPNVEFVSSGVRGVQHWTTIPEDMSESDSDVLVRDAKREDMQQVCQLIKDLAAFEKLEDQVKITTETLIKDGFDTAPPAFRCFVAELQKGRIVGYAIYYTCYSTWLGKSIFLEDLYVDRQYRKNNVGRELMLSVAKVAHETSKRLDFHVLRWNPAAEFYKRIGAVNLSKTEEWELFRLDENCLDKLFTN